MRPIAATSAAVSCMKSGNPSPADGPCMSIRVLAVALLWLATSMAASAQETAPSPAGSVAATLDERIDAAVKPVADGISGFIFHAVRIGGTDAAPVMFPLILGWLVLAGVVFTRLLPRSSTCAASAHGAATCVRGRYSHLRRRRARSATSRRSPRRSPARSASATSRASAVAVRIGGPGATFWMIVAGPARHVLASSSSARSA